MKMKEFSPKSCKIAILASISYCIISIDLVIVTLA